MELYQSFYYYWKWKVKFINLSVTIIGVQEIENRLVIHIGEWQILIKYINAIDIGIQVMS